MSTRDEIEWQDQARLARQDALDQEARDSTRGREAEDESASKPTEKSLELAREFFFKTLGFRKDVVTEDGVNRLATLMDKREAAVRQEQHEATAKQCLRDWIACMDEAVDALSDDRIEDLNDLEMAMAAKFNGLFAAPPPTGETE